MNAPVVAAIAQRRLLKLAYSAVNRIVGMHVSGRKDDGLKLLHCYPIAGESVSYERPGWKLLWVDGIAIIEVFNVRFEQRTRQKANNSQGGSARCSPRIANAD